MVAVDKPVSACCKGVVFLLEEKKPTVQRVPSLEAQYIDPKYGCRVCGKECEVIEEK